MTSFLSLPFRINDMPCGIMGRVSDSYLVTTDLGWISNHSGLKADPAYLYSKRMTLYQSKKTIHRETNVLVFAPDSQA